MDMFQYTSSGLSNVWLRNGYTEKETAYGNTIAIHDIDGLHKAIGMFIVNNHPELSDKEVRFLRKELDITQTQLANILGVGDTTVRNWESGRSSIPRAAGLVLRALYVDYAQGDGTIRNIVDRISQMNRDMFNEELSFEETPCGWQQSAEYACA